LFLRAESFICPVLLNRILREKIAAQVLSFPIGKAWARYVPNIILFGIPLNPGSFTIKEHVIITVMACVSEATPYAVSVSRLLQLTNHVRASQSSLSFLTTFF
jgi:hypothetical protein